MKNQIKKLEKQIANLSKTIVILKEKHYNVNNQINFKKELIIKNQKIKLMFLMLLIILLKKNQN